jgi:hypothetical protein
MFYVEGNELILIGAAGNQLADPYRLSPWQNAAVAVALRICFGFNARSSGDLKTSDA